MQHTTGDVLKILRCDISNTTLHAAEREQRIPEAKRVKRGRFNVRKWNNSDLPAIGKVYGFLTSPSSQKVVSFYIGKGGVLKTTIAYNFARALALNGIKTIIVGLDIQESITTLVLEEQSEQIESLDEIEERPGLYDFIAHGKSIDAVIKRTDLPTLDIIPENYQLNLLEKHLRDLPVREKTFKKKLIKALRYYEVIIFDNSPNWNLLIENSLTASNYIVAPISCETGTFQAVDKNTKILLDFKEALDLEWDDYISVPTLLENTKISKQIYAAYISNYSDTITNSTIKRAVRGQESLFLNKSIFEYAPKSKIADDYFSLIREIWSRMNPNSLKECQ